MNLGSRGKIIIAIIISAIIHACISVFAFFAGLNLIFVLFKQSNQIYSGNNFLVAGIITVLIQIAISVIIGMILYKLTKLMKYAIIFQWVGIPFALFVGFVITSYVRGMYKQRDGSLGTVPLL